MATISRTQMRIEGGERLRRVAAQLKEAGRKDLVKELRSEIRAEGKPTVQDVKRAVLATPSKGLPGGSTAHQGGKGLRAAIARATGMSITLGAQTAGIRIRVRASAIEPATLPKYLDGELSRFSRWRAPTYGHTEWADGTSAWHQQDSHRYFFVTIRRHRDAFRKACLRAMDRVAAKLAGGG